MNRYICNNCGKEFEQHDFSDRLWELFCSMGCVFAWCRARLPKAKPVPTFDGEQ